MVSLKAPQAERHHPIAASAGQAHRFCALTLLLLCGLSAGCGLASLQSVLKQDRLATIGEVQEVQIFRKGLRVATQLGMELAKEDEIRTNADSTAVLRFADGTEIIVAGNTHVKISSLFVFLGEIYVKARGLFGVETEFVTAGVEGTEYLLTVGRGSSVALVVVDGAVSMTSRTGRWAPISVRKFEGATAQGQAAPQRRPSDPAEINRIIRRVNQIARATSTGAALLVPSLTGISENEAGRILSAEGLSVGTVRGRVTRRSPLRAVLDQIPSAGTRLSSGGSVSLVVESEPTRVPHVVGQRIEQARRTLQSLGLVGEENEQITGRSQPGTVIRQSPGAGTEVAIGEPIHLIVESESIVVAGVERLPINQGRKMLLDQGLEVRVREDFTGRARVGTVLSQSPRPGERVRPGTTVDLLVEAEGVVVPNLIGMNQRGAQSGLSESRLSVGNRSTTRSARYPPDTVVEQSPPPGSRVRAGSAVDLVISIGAPTPPILKEPALPPRPAPPPKPPVIR